MTHFVNDDHLNTFRLPVSWQYLVSSPGGTLSSTPLAKYDTLVQQCIAVAQLCILDVRAFAQQSFHSDRTSRSITVIPFLISDSSSNTSTSQMLDGMALLLDKVDLQMRNSSIFGLSLRLNTRTNLKLLSVS